MATLAEYLNTLNQQSLPAGFRLAGIAQQEGDLVSGHNLQTRGSNLASLVAQNRGAINGTSFLDVAAQRLGLNQQGAGLDRQDTGLDRAQLGLNRQGTGLDRQSLGLRQQGIHAAIAGANRDFGLDLNALNSSRAARGAFASSGRRTAEGRLQNSLTDFLGDQNRQLAETGLQGQRLNLTDAGTGLQEQRLGITDQRTGIKERGFGLDALNLGLEAEKENLSLASGLGQLNLSKVYATNGVNA